MYDAAVVGGGAAGLAAASALAAAGESVVLLEARDRLGGRVLTLEDVRGGAPIELGAEFIHGTPAVTFDLLAQSGSRAVGEGGSSWRCESGGLHGDDEPFDDVAQLMDRAAVLERDESVEAFLRRACREDASLAGAAEQIRALVQGFDAADPADASVLAIVEEWRGAASLQTPQFRPSCGYAALLRALEMRLPAERVRVQLQSVVETIEWERGRVRLHGRRFGERFTLEARTAVVTLPAGVLSAGSVDFTPALPAQKREALERIAMGPVLKVAMQFSSPFWTKLREGELRDAAFFYGAPGAFPTFWTTYPALSPIVVAWAGGPKASAMAAWSAEKTIARAVRDFAGVLGLAQSDVQMHLQAAYLHDWQRDPFAMGAYSYLKTGGKGAREALAAPLEQTLFFAGEATARHAEAGTVAGALESGFRAAASAVLRSAQTPGADAESR